MGSSNSTINISNSITESITNSIVRSMQINSSFVNIDQELNLNCNAGTADPPPPPVPGANIVRAKSFYPQCFDLIKTSNLAKDISGFKNLLTTACISDNGKWPKWTCEGKDINLNNFIDIQSLVNQKAVIIETVKNNISQDVNQAAKSQLGAIPSSSTVINKVTQIADIFNNSNFVENLITKLVSNSSQKINLNGGDNYALSISNTSNIISDQIINNSALNNSIIDLSSAISSSVSAQFGTASVGTTVTIVIGVIVTFGILIVLVKKIGQASRNKKSK